MSANCDVIVIFLIYVQFGAIRKPDSGRMICNTTFSLTVTFYLIKTKNRTKKYVTSLIQMLFFCKKNADISKIKGVLVLKGMFSETTYVCVYLHTKSLA